MFVVVLIEFSYLSKTTFITWLITDSCEEPYTSTQV